uniref:Uncharacterized protein n=1 Tax=Avena sativa TaxID=4498 RepID=A0ACD5WES8_AVESA
MPRRPTGGRDGGRAAKQRPPPRRHLYLVTEDWAEGYSIRKVDLAVDNLADTDEPEPEPRRLPPAVLRLEVPHNGPRHFAAAFGTKILFLQLTPWRYAPVFDVRTGCLTFGPRTERIPAAPIYVPLGGDSLFRLDFGRFETLGPPPPPRDFEPTWADEFPEWSWRRLPIPPFARQLVTSHAVHPDGRTFFVSVRVQGRDDAGNTFTFDTGAVDDPGWTCHRGWRLPFKGPAHYDQKLGAWVGLTDDPATLGHLCSCQAPSTDDGGCWKPPAWKLSREKLFRQDNPAEKHAGATLVSLGTGYRSRFCLVECLSRPGSRRHLLRLTTFSPRYHKNGDLGTNRRRRVQSFKLPKVWFKDSGFLESPVAFWL